MRTERNFLDRTDFEREWILDNTWCDACEAADLGMTSPREYDEDGVVYVEGDCARCGSKVRSVISEKDA
jgi:hypothetical protein